MSWGARGEGGGARGRVRGASRVTAATAGSRQQVGRQAQGDESQTDLDADAAFGHVLGEARNAARPVADSGAEANEALVGGQAAIDDAAQHSGVDVAATQRHHHVLAPELAEQGPARQDGGEARGAAALDHELLHLDEAEHGDGNVQLAHAAGAVDAAAGHLERNVAHHGHVQAVCERGALEAVDGVAGGERGGVTRAVLRLDAHDLHARAQSLDGQADASDEASAAHGHDNHVSVGHLL